MEEERISINLHHIFQDHSRHSHDDSYSQSNQPPEELSIQEQVPSLDLSEFKSLNRTPSNFIQPVHAAHANVSAQTQLLSLTKLIKEKECTIKKIQHADPSKIIAKLCQQKSQVCPRVLKKESNSVQLLCLKHVGNKEKEKENSKEAKVIHTSRSSLSRSDVHERLYNISKSQILKQMYFPAEPQKTQPKSHRKSSSSLSSSKYLKNYVPLEKRVEEYLNREKLAASQSMMKSEKDFKPELIPSKYTDRVTSRYRQVPIREGKASDYADFLNSSVSSSCLSTVSRSAQMAQRIEDHFLRKMKLVFVKHPQEEVEVDEATVGLLTEVEFNVLQPFIMQIEEEHIKGTDFQSKFRAFYDTLSPAEKMQLRNHELKHKSKYRQLKKQIKQQKSPKKELFKIAEKVKTATKPKKESKNHTNYHTMIQNFV